MKKYYTRNEIATFNKYRKNVLWKKDKVAGVLDKRSEQREFYEALKKYRNGGINSHEMRSIIGSFYQKTDDHIDRGEAKKLAQEFLGGSRYMLRPGRDRRYVLPRQQNNNINKNTSSGLGLNKSIESKPVSKPRKTIGYSGMRLVN